MRIVRNYGRTATEKDNKRHIYVNEHKEDIEKFVLEAPEIIVSQWI